MRLSIRGYAAHRQRKGFRGGSHVAVSKAIEQGRIRLGRDGKINPKTADQSWALNTRTRGHGPRSGTLAALRLQRELLVFEREKHELAEKRARLVDRDEWEAASRESNLSITQALMAMPASLAPIVATESDRETCHRIIRRETERILSAVADKLALMGKTKSEER